MENEVQSVPAGLQPAFYELNETFDLDTNQLILLEGYKGMRASGTVPAVQPYVFDRDRLRKLLAFLDNPEGDGLLLCGPTGCGKTSLGNPGCCKVALACADGSRTWKRMELDDLLRSEGVWRMALHPISMEH